MSMPSPPPANLTRFRQFFFTTLTATFLAAPRTADAGPDSSWCKINTDSLTSAATAIAAEDTVSALVILVRFTNEVSQPDYSPTGCADDPWPSGATSVPGWASDLLEDTTTPVKPHSMTHFFHTMSGGKHILKGSTYPHVVSLSIDSTDTSWSIVHSRALAAVDADTSFSFAPFDGDSDGFVDMVFFVYRQKFTNPANAFGGGTAGQTGLLGGTSGVSVDGGARAVSRIARVSVIAPNRGFKPIRQTALHEYGHWLGQVAFDLPAGPHLRPLGPFCIMDGTVGLHQDGGEIMSTVMRYRLGWLDPPEVDLQSGTEQTFTLSDVGEDGNDGCLLVRTHVPWQYFLVECRDSTRAIYANGNGVGGTGAGDCDDGARGFSGLIFTHISDRKGVKQRPNCTVDSTFVDGWWESPGGSNDQYARVCSSPDCECDGFEEWCTNENYPPFADIEVSKGMFDATTWAPDPVAGWDAMSYYENFTFPVGHDYVFRQESSNVFAPWTNPSTNLYFTAETEAEYHDVSSCAERQKQNVYSGLTFYNIVGAGGGDMSVTIRYDGATAPTTGQPHPLPNGMLLRGLVQLTQDVLVESGDSLLIDQGAYIVCAARQDAQEAGDYDDRVEILVDGYVDVNGGIGNRVKVTSSRDASFEHVTFNLSATSLPTAGGEQGVSAAPGDWGQIQFRDTADMTISRIAYTDFDYPVFAVEVDSLSSTLFKPTFAHSEKGDVRVRRDTRIAEEAIWSFGPPTRVRIATVANDLTPSGHSFGGNGDGVEILIHGGAESTGPAGADSVWFEPDRTDAPTDTDWQSLTLSSIWGELNGYGDLKLHGAVIRGAQNPIVLEFGRDAEIVDSRIDTYANNGIFDYALDATITGNVIDGLESGESSVSGPLYGIAALRSTGLLSDNTIGWHRQDGIAIMFVKADCDASSPADTLWVTGNTLTGEGAENGSYPFGSGIGVTWGCHHRNIRIEGNAIRDWFSRGVDLNQCADVLLTCNDIEDNKVGVAHDRNVNTSQAGGKNHLKWNTIHGSAEYGLEVLSSSMIALGDASSSQDNDLRPADEDGSNLKKLTGSAQLDARATYWRDETGTLLTTDVAIRAYFDQNFDWDSTDVNIFGFHDQEASEDPCSSESQLRSPGERWLAGDHGSSDLAATGAPRLDSIPARTALIGALPNPSAHGVTIRFDLAATAAGRVSVGVYDVAGRRVTSLVDQALPPGRHAVEWSRSGERTGRVPPGVYFVRMTAPGYAANRKVVLVR